jgi:hypothetical protein
MTRIQRQIPDDGGYSKMVGTDHQTNDDDHEPPEGGGTSEASSKCTQNFIHIFQHGLVDRDEIGYTIQATLYSDLLSFLA